MDLVVNQSFVEHHLVGVRLRPVRAYVDPGRMAHRESVRGSRFRGARGQGVISSLLVGVDPADPLVLVSAATILAGVAAIATLVPVARAVRIAPTEVLKGD
ncbi:MAG: hypothetical protein P8170_19130 [Gemmatimonadota bacterium]